MTLLIPLVVWASLQAPRQGMAVDGSSAVADLAVVDPNTANWYELAQLPGIGETIAKRIVAHRAALTNDGRAQAYRSAADLDAVPGIGRRTVDRIAPLLVFSPLTDSSPDSHGVAGRRMRSAVDTSSKAR